MKYKKTCETSIRVLQTLKFLTQKSARVSDIIRHFEEIDPNSRIYTNEVILKYINTLKVFGFRIIKEKDKYTLLNTPNKFNFDKKDLTALLLLENILQTFPEDNIKSEVKSFIQNLEKNFSDDTRLTAHEVKKPEFSKIKVNYDKYKKQVKEYEKYCQDKQRLKIFYKYKNSEISTVVEPDEIKYSGSSIFLRVYNPVSAQIHDINFDDILKIEQLPVKSNCKNMFSSVSFKLKGRLAKSYKLHEGERLLNTEDSAIIVLNQKEDRTLLLNRLMRYGENCELISPKDLRKEIKNKIKTAISNNI